MSHDFTSILERARLGERKATNELLPLVYAELRTLAAKRMASESLDNTLQPTALVHEAYLRLINGEADAWWENREHFFRAAAEAMRRILIDSARARRSDKRGGGRQTVEYIDSLDPSLPPQDLLIDLDDAIASLEVEDEPVAELVKLRLYAGLSTEAAGALLGMSRATAFRIWEFARSWFAVRLEIARPRLSDDRKHDP